jgi:dienelactone hydrolase
VLTPATLEALLGRPAKDGPAQLTLGPATPHAGHALHKIRLRQADRDISGLLLRPTGAGPYPAVVYCHAHGNRYAIGAEELVQGRPALWAPYGPALADLGIASAAIDLAPFGSRQSEGSESALAKAALWAGHTSMGHMLAELGALFDALAGLPLIDANRIGTLGLSMGGTHAYWLAALEPRVAACAHLCVFADIAPMIETGAHDLHGPYMTVPGLLRHGDMGDVAALVAPRPQWVALGADDPLTPPVARDPALARLAQAYGGDTRLEPYLSPGTGHVETAEMRAKTLAFLQRHLTP